MTDRPNRDSKQRRRTAACDPFVGKFFLSFEFGDLQWHGQVLSRQRDHYVVQTESLMALVLTGFHAPEMFCDEDAYRQHRVRADRFKDWRFFNSMEERESFASEHWAKVDAMNGVPL